MPRKPPPERYWHVGVFPLGVQNVLLLADANNTGGDFETMPDAKVHADDNGLPRIIIGLAYWRLNRAVNVLLHEATEMAYVLHGLRFQQSTAMLEASDTHHFIFDHNQFTQATADVAAFITMALPTVQQMWKKAQKARKARR